MTELSPVVGFGAVGFNTRDESLSIFCGTYYMREQEKLSTESSTQRPCCARNGKAGATTYAWTQLQQIFAVAEI